MRHDAPANCAGAAGAVDDVGVSGGTDALGGAAATNGGVPAATAGGADALGGAGAGAGGQPGGETSDGGALGDAGAGGAAAAGTLEYADDFNDVGAWQLVAEPNTGLENASAEIEDGQLFLYAEQVGFAPTYCPGEVSAALLLPDVEAAPLGAVTTWILDLSDNGGSGSSHTELRLSRAPREILIDLVSLPPKPGRLVVRVAEGSVTTSYAGLPVAATYSTDYYSGTTAVSLNVTACAVDLGAESQVGVTRLEVRTD